MPNLTPRASLAVCLTLLACGGGTDSVVPADAQADSPFDAGTDAAAAADTGPGADADADADAAPDAGPSATYSDISDVSKWSSFDLQALHPNTYGYAGGAFDGRYVYFAHYFGGTGGLLTRYDTQSNAFTTPSSWTIFDTSTLPNGPTGFQGAVLVGTKLFLVPYSSTRVVVYDTTQPFGQAGSYSQFDVATVDPNAKNFVGGGFDGKYVYFAPYYGAGKFLSVVMRYDTAQSLSTPAAWETFDLSPIDPFAMGYSGVVCTGRYVYLIPSRRTNGIINGAVTRFDTQGSGFKNAASWSVYNTFNVGNNAGGYQGGAFDGKNLYLIAGTKDATRYDTTQPFAMASSYTTFTPSTLDASAVGFALGSFDGRYVYYGANAHSRVVRVDSQGTFGAAAAWSSFETSALTPAGGATGAQVFDGRYLYFAPANGSSVALRFDAKTPASMPKVTPAGSFF